MKTIFLIKIFSWIVYSVDQDGWLNVKKLDWNLKIWSYQRYKFLAMWKEIYMNIIGWKVSYLFEIWRNFSEFLINSEYLDDNAQFHKIFLRMFFFYVILLSHTGWTTSTTSGIEHLPNGRSIRNHICVVSFPHINLCFYDFLWKLYGTYERTSLILSKTIFFICQTIIFATSFSKKLLISINLDIFLKDNYE